MGLVGDNGAGKSTLIKLLSGAHRPDEGSILVEGKQVDLHSPKEAMRLGVETIYQYTAMIPAMSIARNIFIGREPLRGSFIFGIGLIDRRKMAQHAIDSLANIDLRTRSPETLGRRAVRRPAAGGRHRARHVLQVEGPDPGRADQPPVGQGDQTGCSDYVASLKEQGITSIFISHNLHHIHPIADRIVAMARGEKIADVRKADISMDEMTAMIV